MNLKLPEKTPRIFNVKNPQNTDSICQISEKIEISVQILRCSTNNRQYTWRESPQNIATINYQTSGTREVIHIENSDKLLR